jgi:hypothetical protein
LGDSLGAWAAAWLVAVIVIDKTMANVRDNALARGDVAIGRVMTGRVVIEGLSIAAGPGWWLVRGDRDRDAVRVIVGGSRGGDLFLQRPVGQRCEVFYETAPRSLGHGFNVVRWSPPW